MIKADHPRIRGRSTVESETEKLTAVSGIGMTRDQGGLFISLISIKSPMTFQ